MTHLEKLHNKPSHEKRRLAMQISTVITGLVFAGWLVTLGPRILAQVSPADDTSGDSRSAGHDVFGVMASVGSALSGQWGQAQAALSAVDATSTGTAPVPQPAPVPTAAPASVIVLPDSVPVDAATTTVAPIDMPVSAAGSVLQ